MTSPETLEITRRKSKLGVLLRLKGVIDAGLDRSALADDLADLVVFDLDGVDRITSFGVREWLQALAVVNAQCVAFYNVRPTVVSQFNMVGGFNGPGQLVTMYLPYMCTGCSHEFEVLWDLRDDQIRAQLNTPPDTKCPECGEEAEFDDVPRLYFQFASRQPKPTLPPQADRLLRGKEEEFDLRKEIAGDVTALWLSGPFDAQARVKRAIDGLEGHVVVILQNVSDVEAEGIPQLKRLLKSEQQLHLARMPLCMMTAMASIDVGQHRIASVILPFHCPTCDITRDVELNHDQLANALGKRNPPTCPQCNTAVVMDGYESLLEYALGLVSSEPLPDAIQQYLKAHDKLQPRTVLRLQSEFTGDTSSSGLQRYEVLRVLGSGGMATVSLARRRGPAGFDKKVALKELLPALAKDATFRRMFLDEARIAAHINHPNVVQIYDLGTASDSFYIAMEYVKGADLSMLLRLATRLGMSPPHDLCCRIMADVAAGLQAAHECADENGQPLNIVHRDVSPHNILLSHDGVPKIADFGIAKARSSIGGTKSGQLKGKVIYMAPEQVDDQLGPVDARSDLFAAGLVLYRMLTGVDPFRRDSEILSLHAVVQGDIARPSTLVPVAPVIEDLVMRAVERRPDARFQTAAELRDALETVLLSFGRPVTTSHVAQWAKLVFERGVMVGEIAFPSNTPTSLTPMNTHKKLAELGVELPTSTAVFVTPTHAKRIANHHADAAKDAAAADADADADLDVDVDVDEP